LTQHVLESNATNHRTGEESPMTKKEKTLKELQRRIISELLMDSKRSDRQLARLIGVSQPTVTRTRTHLQQEGYIEQYTIIPNFIKLGYEIIAITFVKTATLPNREDLDKLRKMAKDLERRIAFNTIMAYSGQGLGYGGVIISLHQDYNSYLKLREEIKQFPFTDRKNIETFMISLKSDFAYRPLTLATLAKHLLTLEKPEHSD
jgi:DNA-binding Lrp family transcriptional regulator